MDGVCVLAVLVGERREVVLEGRHGDNLWDGNKNKIKISLILYACIINLILPGIESCMAAFKELRLQQ